MWYPQFKTVVLTSMFISVLFLTGCGKQEETKAVTSESPTPAMEQTTQPANDGENNDDTSDENGPDRTPTTTPGATTNTPDTSVSSDAWKSYGSTFQTYKTPAGDEEVKVTATIDGQGIVKKVELAYVTHAPKSKTYQDLFTAGIAEQVVGKSIKDVKVGVVNGSSLTSEWFNKAIDQIENMYYASAN